MRIFYWLRAKFRAWKYKRKFGINIEEGIMEYGRNVILTEEKNENNTSKTECKPKTSNTCVFKRDL